MVEVKINQQGGHDFLWIDKELWMWDTPWENKLQKDLADRALGRVLVAGYGLGKVHEGIIENPEVLSLETIEKYPEVIDACKKRYGEVYGDITIGDFNDYNFDKKYHCVIGDIWQEIHPKFLPEYKQFKEKAETLLIPGGKILTWGEDFFEYLISRED